MATPKKTATGRCNIQIEVANVCESNTLDSKREAEIWAARPQDLPHIERVKGDFIVSDGGVETPISRRAALNRIGAAGLVSLTSSLAGCGGGDGTSTPTTNETLQAMVTGYLDKLLMPTTSKNLGILKYDDNTYYVWRPLGGVVWQRCSLTRTGAGIPLNWNETWLKQVYGYITCTAVGVTYTGAWSNTTSTTYNLTTPDVRFYVNGRGKQSTAAGESVEIPYNGGGDLYIVYTSRASGCYVNVTIDGGVSNVILPNDANGKPYFDTYSSTDLVYKQIVKIASKVAVGSHKIRLTTSALKNSASTGGRFIFCALAFDSDELGPWSSSTDAAQWVSGATVLQNEERKYSGNYYYASASGTTGPTAPTHTTGSVSDGGVTWVYRAASSYNSIDHRIQAVGSQLEYAYEMQPTGASETEDVGGALHGNEVQDSLAFRVDGNSATLTQNVWVTGSVIDVVEGLHSYHSQIGAGATPVINTHLTRSFQRPFVEITHTHTLEMDLQFGYFYSHMWPMVHYSSVGQKYGLRKLWTPTDGDSVCSSYYGLSKQFIGKTKDYLMMGYGDALQPDGSGGVPTVIPATKEFVAWLSVSPSSVSNFDTARDIFAAKMMNTNGINVSAGGYSSMTSKMYFERYPSSVPTAKTAGYSFTCSAKYGMIVRDKI